MSSLVFDTKENRGLILSKATHDIALPEGISLRPGENEVWIVLDGVAVGRISCCTTPMSMVGNLMLEIVEVKRIDGYAPRGRVQRRRARANPLAVSRVMNTLGITAETIAHDRQRCIQEEVARQREATRRAAVYTLHGLADEMARELVRINFISPGTTDRDLLQKIDAVLTAIDGEA